jgi:hypothetical protein
VPAREVEVLPARVRHWAERCQKVEAPGDGPRMVGCLVTGAVWADAAEAR